MRTLFLTIIFIGWAINIYACDNANITIEENGHRKNIKFNHIVYTTHADQDGYYDCHHIYTIDPMSKLKILHRSDFMMNNFMMDSMQLPQLSNDNIVMESNLSLCRGYEPNMSVYSKRENIEFINNDIVCIETNNYFYGAGAAHGHSRVEHFIYERKNGMKLGWDDLFKDKRIEKYILDRVVNELASREYLKNISKNNYSFIREFYGIDPKTVLMNFKESGYFTIVNEGLKVQYNAYDIAPYVAGQPSLIVPKKILKDYMSKKVYDMCFSNKSRIKIIKE